MPKKWTLKLIEKRIKYKRKSSIDFIIRKREKKNRNVKSNRKKIKMLPDLLAVRFSLAISV